MTPKGHSFGDINEGVNSYDVYSHDSYFNCSIVCMKIHKDVLFKLHHLQDLVPLHELKSLVSLSASPKNRC